MSEKKPKAIPKPKSKPKAKSTTKAKAKNQTQTSAETASASVGFKAKAKQGGIWFAWTCSKLMLAFMLGLVIYVIYLDAKVTRKFEGKKWQIPAQIYAKPLSLFIAKPITKAQLIEELEALNYRNTNRLDGAGEYKVEQNRLSLVRRAFNFPGRSEGERWLTIVFERGEIVQIRDNQSLQAVVRVSLEPLLIERLLSPHHEDREFLPLEAFPELFKDTLLLVEDRDFYHHIGVSLTATARALWQNIKAGRTVQGGSTLTQQLAKNFYLNHKRNLVRKINEAFIALILDFRYSKDQILEAYVNEVFLGQFNNRSIHGFGLASQYYFSKPINELQPSEFAVLMAIIKGPSYYSPHRQAKRTLERRDLVLRLMFEHHLLDKNEYQTAIVKPLGVSDKKQFLPLRYPAYIGQVRRELKRTIKDSDILSDGIRVFTYLEPRLQRASEKVITEQLPLIESEHKIANIEAVSVSVNVKEAAISAMVGSRNVNFSGLNRAVDMRRNIGSLIKPAVFLTALADPDQYSLATLLKDEPITLLNQHGKKWSPENFSKSNQGQVSLLHSLSESKNIPTVNLGMALGVDKVTQSLKALGITSAIPKYPSLFLGALELSPLEVSQMYATIADKGVYQKLSTLAVVTTNDGGIIWQRAPTAKVNFSSGAVYLTNVALKEVTNTGTAKRLKWTFPKKVFAGKTGTTDELRDSWFSGFDNKTLTTFWVGKDDYSPVGLTGNQGALRLFGELYKIMPAFSLPDLPPSSISEHYFSPKTGFEYQSQCGDAIGLPAIDSALSERVECD
jgi:penicillin-binding protein 1B